MVASCQCSFLSFGNCSMGMLWRLLTWLRSGGRSSLYYLCNSFANLTLFQILKVKEKKNVAHGWVGDIRLMILRSLLPQPLLRINHSPLCLERTWRKFFLLLYSGLFVYLQK